MVRTRLGLVVGAVLAAAAQAHGATPPAVTSDPPVDKAHPATIAYVQVPSHGALMNGVLYTASGAGPHPTVLLLHGFPGNEQNLDLAQAMRRAGLDVLTLHYRGSWGSPGGFSFTHAIEDADAALAFLHDPASVSRYRIDPRHIFAAGHSMGGFMAASAASHDRSVAGVIMISAWDIGVEGAKFQNPLYRMAAAQGELKDDVIPLAGASLKALMDEAQANAARWDFVDEAPALRSRPVLLIAADDGNYPDSHRLAQALHKGGDPSVTEVHMATDHSYSDHRIALESAVVDWLQQQIARGGSLGRAP